MEIEAKNHIVISVIPEVLVMMSGLRDKKNLQKLWKNSDFSLVILL